MWVSQIAGVTSVPGGSVWPSTCSSAGEAAAGDRHHRAQPQRLGDHRPQVGVVVAAGHLLGQPLRRRRVAQQQVEAPGERGRCRLVAGEQQGHQLVAQLAVLHRPAVLESRRDQGREDVVALLQIGIRPPLGDLREQLAHRPRAAAPGSGRRARGRRTARVAKPISCATGRGGLPEDPAQQLAQAAEALGIGDPEDGAQNHLQGHRLHPRVDRGTPRRAARSRSPGRSPR